MVKCKHPYSSQVQSAEPKCWVCLRCNARGVSSLGTSNDSLPEVQIEIRAAEIAATIEMSPLSIPDDELWGRMLARGMDPPPSAAPYVYGRLGMAGFLSAIIEEDETAVIGWDWDSFKPIAGQWPNVPIPESEPPPAFRRNGCPDLDPALPDSAGYPRGPVLCVLYPRCQCGESDQASVIAEQTRHDVAASVVGHAEIEQPDAATAWSEYAAGNVKTVEEFEAVRVESPEETARAHARIEAGIAKLETDSAGDPDWQAKVWAEIGGES